MNYFASESDSFVFLGQQFQPTILVSSFRGNGSERPNKRFLIADPAQKVRPIASAIFKSENFLQDWACNSSWSKRNKLNQLLHFAPQIRYLVAKLSFIAPEASQ